MNKTTKTIATGLATATLFSFGGANVAHAEQSSWADKAKTKSWADKAKKQIRGNQAKASEKDWKDKDTKKEIDEPIFAEGANLSKEEDTKTKHMLHVDKKAKNYKIDTKMVKDFTGNTYEYITSSAYIQPKKFNKGVTVHVKTPKNIQKVSEQDYTNAAITAGIKDANIDIASTQAVSGAGALTGIYTSMNKEGHNIDKEDAKNANEEVSQVSTINHQNEDVNGYSDEKLNKAIAQMKSQVAEEQQNGNDLEKKNIEKIVTGALKDEHIEQKINDHQKDIIVNIIVDVANSKAMKDDPDSFKKQTDKLQDKLSYKIKNTKVDKSTWEKFWDKIKSIF